MKKRGVCISQREYKFEFYGVDNENIELVDSKTDLPLFAAVLVGVLSVGCVNNHVALLEAHSIGS